MARPAALALALALAASACSSSTEPSGGATTAATGTTATATGTTATGTGSGATTGTSTLGTMTIEALHAALPAKDFLLINVHVPHDGDIPGTDAALTYEDVDAIAAFVGPDLGKDVVVYCMGTSMSKPVGTELVARGYTSVRYLLGGYSAWEKAGWPLEK